MSKRDELKTQLLLEIKGCKLPTPTHYGDNELQFAPPRRWKFDFAWAEHKIALEIEGGGSAQKRRNKKTGQLETIPSRHFTTYGFAEDQDKYTVAMLMGWKVVHVNYFMIEKGGAIDLIDAMFAPIWARVFAHHAVGWDDGPTTLYSDAFNELFKEKRRKKARSGQ